MLSLSFPEVVDASVMLKFLATSLLIAITSSLLRFGVKVYHSRMHLHELRMKGLPVSPGWNWAFGNLLYIGSIRDTLPRNAHKTLVFSEILRRFFPQQGCCYLDLWPVSWPFLMIMSPTLATQATQTSPQIVSERPPRLDQFFEPLAGGPNLFDMPGEEWKPWRVVFNKGFSADNISSLVPGMVEEAIKYRDTLKKFALSGELFQLDPVTLRFTMDFIGRTVLNASLGLQTGYNALADSMLHQITWQMRNREVNPLELLNLPRYVVQWYNGRKMDKYIGVELDKRYREYQQDKISPNLRSKSVIDLVLQTYVADSQGRGGIGTGRSQEQLDPRFRTFAIRQIRLFLFVGHDSMSSTICYAVHLLSSNPQAMSRLRAEHDEVLGHDISTVSSVLTTKPHLLGSLPYTTAVIKETLRLFPPGSGIRQGVAGSDLVGEDGTRYPTENTIIWILHTAMHRAPEYWVDPDAFLPERWLVEPGHSLYPQKGAWRAFEWGPRNCIGQSLAMTELRITLAIVAREFDVKPAYDEWDRLHPHQGVQTYRGERAYQIEEASAHPADHYPCRLAMARRH